jgi:toxin CcdB
LGGVLGRAKEILVANLAVYRNTNPKTKKEVPYLLDVQSELLVGLGTRVVIPLYSLKLRSIRVIARLTPKIVVEGETFILMTPQLAGINASELGEPVTTVQDQRTQIISALDMLFSGF